MLKIINPVGYKNSGLNDGFTTCSVLFSTPGQQTIDIQQILPQADGVAPEDFAGVIELRYFENGRWNQTALDVELVDIDSGEDVALGWRDYYDDTDYYAIHKQFAPDAGVLIYLNGSFKNPALNLAGEVIPLPQTDAETIAVGLNDGFTVCSIAIPTEKTFDIQEVIPSSDDKEPEDFAGVIELRYFENGRWNQTTLDVELVDIDSGEDVALGWRDYYDDTDYYAIHKEFSGNACVLIYLNGSFTNPVLKFPNPLYIKK